MTSSGVVLDVLGPVVLVVACGAFVGPRLKIDSSTLSRLAYWILGPALMFDLLATTELRLDVIGTLALAGLSGMLAAGALAVVGSLIAKDSYELGAASVMCSSYGNVGNAGLAISAFALGDEILPAAGVFMLAINVSGMMLGVGLAHGRSGSFGRAIGKSLTAPMAMSGLTAMALNLLSVDVPRVIDRTVHLTGGALIPILLFTFGLQLRVSSGIRLSSLVVKVSVAKLIVAPVAAATVAAALGLSGDLLAVSVVQSAMPPAVFCMVVAMEHDLEPDEVTSMVVLTTGFSLLTLPVVLWIFV